jgi:hypothetical protein
MADVVAGDRSPAALPEKVKPLVQSSTYPICSIMPVVFIQGSCRAIVSFTQKCGKKTWTQEEKDYKTKLLDDIKSVKKLIPSEWPFWQKSEGRRSEGKLNRKSVATLEQVLKEVTFCSFHAELVTHNTQARLTATSIVHQSLLV